MVWLGGGSVIISQEEELNTLSCQIHLIKLVVDFLLNLYILLLYYG